MFILSEVKDSVPIFPTNFGLPTHEAITSYLNKKYANKILQQVGFCLAVWDLVECGDGKVRWGDGAVWYKVKFNLLVFQPFSGEVLVGKVLSSTPDRIRISLGFFDDIYILISSLPADEFFFDPEDPDQPTGAHYWLVPLDEDAPSDSERTKLPILNNDMIRFRITASKFQEHEPRPPSERSKIVDGMAVPVDDDEDEQLPSWLLEATIAEQGLGVTGWWPAGDDEDQEEADELAMDES
ncbi:DNA-directed RNA polymerase subunit E' [Phaffia rhodozyma]|uniref:DNA-directed RNA polymerase subunit E n=1 Tax=Phaffia rhodozyma TaxID=264483 RepID=A0A0F7SHU8_PHARH|nr:DNA-directed RNA polymerase subunit E' [Phaffia rhodozyma]